MDSGITRRIDDLGKIVIPAEIRRLFSIVDRDHLMFTVDRGSILLRNWS
jgi:AbrB family looped-hinge helix DNA binding protein